MDYCFTCRRTLNGALVCPGCGAYAPDIVPPAAAQWESSYPAHARAAGAAEYIRDGKHSQFAATGPSAEVLASPRESGESAGGQLPGCGDGFGPGGGWGGYDDADPGANAAESESESVLGPTSLAPAPHRGRAARRRQVARWQKNRRRAAAATAVALFGGGLTIEAMPSHSKGGATTATAGTPVSPTSLVSDGDTSLTPPSDSSAPAGGHPHTTVVPQQRIAPGAPGRTAPPSHVTTDSSGTIVLPGSTSAAPTGTEQVAYSGSRQPPVRSTSPSSTSAATGSGTGTGTGTGSGTTAGNGATTGTGSGTTTGSTDPGSGTTTATPPTSAPPATPPATSDPTPPPAQLCVLILCLG